MLRTVAPQPTLWEALLPESCLALPPGLAEVDQLLDDQRFFEPFRPFFDPVMGRPSVPVETYLRMMFLRFRYRLGFETLCREVADSLAWRRFCRIPLDAEVPHPTTLMKITSRCGEPAVDGLNEALLATAHEQKLVRLDKVRADTTVVPANVAHPSDAGLLARGVARLAKLCARVHEAGYATRTVARNRTRSMRRRAHAIGAWLRRRSDEARSEVLAITAEMADIAELAAAEANDVVRNARRSLRKVGKRAPGKAKVLIDELERTVALVDQVVAQARVRVGGGMPDGATRVVSLHDPDARPIAKGRIGKPVEFGYKGQLVDNADGIILDHRIIKGNPPDAPLLAPAVRRITARFGKAPRTVVADRGYGEAAVDAELEAAGVRRVVIPRKGRANAARQRVQLRPSFVRLVKWRTGCEGRIAYLKRGYGWERTLYDGEAGAQTWCGWGVLTHNAMKIAALADAKQRRADARAGP